MVEDAKEKGADCLMGGAPHPAGELFYQPTILTGVQPNMALFQVARCALYVPDIFHSICLLGFWLKKDDLTRFEGTKYNW